MFDINRQSAPACMIGSQVHKNVYYNLSCIYLSFISVFRGVSIYFNIKLYIHLNSTGRRFDHENEVLLDEEEIENTGKKVN